MVLEKEALAAIYTFVVKCHKEIKGLSRKNMSQISTFSTQSIASAKNCPHNCFTLASKEKYTLIILTVLWTHFLTKFKSRAL